MAGEPATTVRDMEALRRMGGAGVRGRERGKCYCRHDDA